MPPPSCFACCTRPTVLEIDTYSSQPIQPTAHVTPSLPDSSEPGTPLAAAHNGPTAGPHALLPSSPDQVSSMNPLFRGVNLNTCSSSEASTAPNSNVQLVQMGLMPETPPAPINGRASNPFFDSKSSRVLQPSPLKPQANGQRDLLVGKVPVVSESGQSTGSQGDLQHIPAHQSDHAHLAGRPAQQDESDMDEFVSCQGSFTSMKSAQSEWAPTPAGPAATGDRTSAGSATAAAAASARQAAPPGRPPRPPVWQPQAHPHPVGADHADAAGAHVEASGPSTSRTSRTSHGFSGLWHRNSQDKQHSSRPSHRTSHPGQATLALEKELAEDLDVPTDAAGATTTWDTANEHVALLCKVARQYKATRYPCQPCSTITAHCHSTHTRPVALLQLLRAAPDSIEGVSKKDLVRLVRAAAQMEAATHFITDDSDWKLVVNMGPEFQMFYQHDPHTTTHCFKGRAVLDSPIEHIVALTREFDLCSTWNKFCVESVVAETHSDMEMLCIAVQWMPWPLHNMNVVVEAVGTDLLDTAGGFLITFYTPKDYKDPKLLAKTKLAKPNNMAIRMMPGSGVFIEPLPPLKPGGPQRTRACLCVRVDPGIRHVPGVIISWVLKTMGPMVYKLVLDLLKKEFSDPKSPIPARIPERPFLYELVKEHSAEHLRKLAEKERQAQEEQLKQQQQGQAQAQGLGQHTQMQGLMPA